jgi:16S rRNA (guanine(966)-N(2))-methyltransferase RsmD
VRIIAGEFRSRRLLSPPEDWALRPLPDRVKESLFALLRGHCEGGVFVDAFAGTGSFGLEAISRGAARCVFIERDRRHAELLRTNINSLRAEDRAEVVVSDALGPGALARCPRPTTVVFLDPPYDLVSEPVGWRRVRDQAAKFVELISDDGFLVLRTPWPFLHEPEASGAGRPESGSRRPEAAAGRRGRGARKQSADTEEGTEAAQEGQTGRPARIAPDLSIAGAAGPETHEYGSTAAHLYMRRSPRRLRLPVCGTRGFRRSCRLRPARQPIAPRRIILRPTN